MPPAAALPPWFGAVVDREGRVGLEGGMVGLEGGRVGLVGGRVGLEGDRVGPEGDRLEGDRAVVVPQEPIMCERNEDVGMFV